MNRGLWKKIGYWTFSTILLLVLFFVIFGLVPLIFLENENRDHVKVFASLFAVIGLLVMVIAVHNPGLAWKTFIMKEGGPVNPGLGHRILLLALGGCFVIGGLLYAYTGNISAVIGSFFIFVVGLRLFWG